MEAAAAMCDSLCARPLAALNPRPSTRHARPPRLPLVPGTGSFVPGSTSRTISRTVGRTASQSAVSTWPAPRSRRVGVAAASADGAGAGGPGNGSGAEGGSGAAVLKKGDAVVIVEEPPFVKTAEPMPMLRNNEGGGMIQKGDVGRIIDSHPKNVWAVRLATGAFLLDRKYIELLQ